MALAPGSHLGPYEIQAPLGAGGMGEVYRARDPRLGRDVAIKVLPEAVEGAAAWARFQREARAASALSHPHICAVYDVGEHAGRPYIVMELVAGSPLSDLLATGPLDASVASDYGAQIADALTAAHARGVIHRDIKPGNIIVSDGRHVKVLDFGIARTVAATAANETQTADALTEDGALVGTPAYMAPEALQQRGADARSDIWSLGATLYEMLAARRPFGGGSSMDVAAAVLREPVPPLPPTVPAGLRAIVDRCLAKSPDERYQAAHDVRRALEAFRVPAATPARSTRWPWRVAAAAAAAGILVLAAFAFGLVGRPEAPPDRQRTVTGAPASANPDANDAFALAMQFQRVQNDIVRGQQQLERALALDPHFAEARRYHAFSYVILVLNGYSNDPSLAYKAEDELHQAERDDPTLASLPSAFAAVHLLQGRKEMIPMAALDSAAVNASTARDAMLWLAIVHWLAGENQDVKALVRRSLDREPLFAAPRMFLGETLRTEGDVAGAIREHRRVLEQAPGNISAIWWLTLAYLDANQRTEARALLEAARSQFSTNYLWRTAWALLLAHDGRRSEALAAMDDETAKFTRSVFVATAAGAEFWALVGDTARALEWIEAAVRNGDERVDWFRRNQGLASIQSDPRFTQILQSIEARRRPRPSRP